MAVRIRLRRIGRKKQPSYRLVVADSQSPRSGEYIETLGFYNPRTQPAELRVDLEKVDQWLARGAEMSETAASLIRKARKGGARTVRLITATTPEAAAAPAPKAAKPGKRGRAAQAAPQAAGAEPRVAPEAAREPAGAERQGPAEA